MTENKCSKHLLYAIAEILLVVIGILVLKTHLFTILCPVRDVISVEQIQPINQRAFRYAT
ncbi:hypothetical protein LX77_03453 [Gelidibacter algens]|uniref:Uncharacterized protein n=1 Tax=Gelidibacter algens TaxID=49280 RepID=A0A327RRS2_9FLAO|nr:hypothetical protein [Gelidibacter algens]RAJ19710.1 hypothetical protein LX77_03453 [Gelidibacter algens]